MSYRMARANLKQLEWYLMDTYDVHVSFEKDGADEYWFDPENFEEDKGVISIDSSKSLSHQLHVLLHEAGHVVLRSDSEEFKKRFPGSRRDTIDGRIEILREEVLAWDKSVEVAERLGIELNDKKWQKDYRGALKKYIEWVSKGDDNEK